MPKSCRKKQTNNLQKLPKVGKEIVKKNGPRMEGKAAK